MPSSIQRFMARIKPLCDRAGLDREDRLELARVLFPTLQIDSFSDLEDDELEDIIYALKAWANIQEIRLANGTLHAEARVLLDEQGSRPAATEQAVEESRAGRGRLAAQRRR